METYFFNYSVNSAYVCTEFEEYVPSEGNELLVTEVTIENTDRESIVMWDDDFQVQWNDDAEDAYAWIVPKCKMGVFSCTSLKTL